MILKEGRNQYKVDAICLRNCILTAIFIILSSSIYAKKKAPFFKHISVEDGLSNTNITCMLQDSEGFLWFGTEDGLNKFDGNSFTVYSGNVGTPSFSGNYIFDIIEDSDKDLWIATTYGLNIYKRKAGTFTSYLPAKNNADSISDEIIRSGIEDHNGILWFGTKSGKINIFNKKEKKFSIFNCSKGSPFNKDKSSIADLLEDDEGNIWVLYVVGNSIDIINNERDSTFSIDLATNDPADKTPIAQRSIIEDREHSFWVGTMGSGLLKITKSDGKYAIERFHNDPQNPHSIAGNRILSLWKDTKSGIWLGIENTGLTYLNPTEKIFTNFTSEIINTGSIANNSVWSIFQDNENGLWVGTYSSGINYWNSASKKFNLVRSNPLNKNGLSNNIVTSFFDDSNGTFWVGTSVGGLNKYDQSKGTFSCFNTQNSTLKSNAIKAIFEDSKKNLWVGTYGGGIYLHNKKNNAFINFNSKNTNLIGDNFSTIAEDKNGVVWFGSYWGNGGLCRYNEKKNDFDCFTTKNSEISDNTIFKILPGRDGNLWLATQKGLCKFNPEKTEFTTYNHNPNDTNTVSHPNIHSIIEGRDSLLWVVTAHGLNSFYPKTGKFRRYLKNNSHLPDNFMFAIEKDEMGNLWISSKTGLSKFNPKSGKVVDYTVADGLQGKEYLKASSYLSPKGILYFGGTNGYNYFDPKQIKDDTIVPRLFFTNLRIFNNIVHPGTINSPLENRNINYLDTIKLSYNQSVFTIEYTALNFTYPDKTKYAYVLEGFEKEWNYVGTQKSATYTNLDPGKYTFKVKLPFSNGVMNETGISMVIIITPPFYETWWFRLIALSAIIGSIIGIYYLRVNNIEKRNKELEEKVIERTQEIIRKNNLLRIQSDELLKTNSLLAGRQEQILEQSKELKAQKESLLIQRDELTEANSVKDRLFSIIAHDLKNPFNTLNGFAELLHEKYNEFDEDERSMMIAQIYESSNLLYGLLEQLLTWSMAQRGKIVFRPKNENLIEIINKNIELATDQAKVKKISIKLLIERNEVIVNMDVDLVNTIIRNLVSNAIKFTPMEGTIIVQAIVEANRVVMSVKDSGIGISEENIDKLFADNIHFTSAGTTNEKGTGLGLAICKEFVKKHHGEIWVKSKLGKGSIFSFSLPLNIPE
jgi:signal transduction histidine kinase/ligand-binding sensor domain-containing protein